MNVVEYLDAVAESVADVLEQVQSCAHVRLRFKHAALMGIQLAGVVLTQPGCYRYRTARHVACVDGTVAASAVGAV